MKAHGHNFSTLQLFNTPTFHAFAAARFTQVFAQEVEIAFRLPAQALGGIDASDSTVCAAFHAAPTILADGAEKCTLPRRDVQARSAICTLLDDAGRAFTRELICASFCRAISAMTTRRFCNTHCFTAFAPSAAPTYRMLPRY